ncbi:MAG: YdeI/OmpD-associated family protein [Gemmatimonadaceae bacterium]
MSVSDPCVDANIEESANFAKPILHYMRGVIHEGCPDVALSPSHRREYVEWISEPKTKPTRDKRLTTGLDWIAEGKSRNWKYER